MGDLWFDQIEESTIPKVPERPWEKKCRMELVTVDTMERVADECIESGRFACDVETSGLDNRIYDGRTVDQIVGWCLSPDGVRGYYAPVRHVKGSEHNLPLTQWEAHMHRVFESGAIAIFHMAEFDQEFLEFNGGKPFGSWDNPDSWDCTLILAYLSNSRMLRKSLKFLSNDVLGREMLELDDLFPANATNKNFSKLDPSHPQCIRYGCGDAINTYGLFDHFHPLVVNPQGKLEANQAGVYKLEKMTLAATRWMHRCRIHMDRQKANELILLGEADLIRTMADLYEAGGEVLKRDITPAYFRYLREKFQPGETSFDDLLADCRKRAKREHADPEGKLKKGTKSVQHVYDVLSNQQLAALFVELEIPGLKYTEKGQVKTSQEELDRITEKHGDSFPFMKKIQRVREIRNALSKWLYPARDDPDDRDNTVRVHYNGHKVETGRFSVKSKRKKDYLGETAFNVHSAPAPYDTKRPECMFRIRETIIPRGGKIMASVDLSGMELRLITNISGEPEWIEEFYRCGACGHTFERGEGKGLPPETPSFCPACGSDKIGDLHTKSGLLFYGDSAQERSDWKHLRNNAKRANFAACYGGGGRAIQRSIGCDKNEGWRIVRQFNSGYPVMKAWREAQVKFARKHKYVLSAFGRKYPLPDIDHEEGYFRSEAERNAVNGPIQQSNADILKLAMALIYRQAKQREWIGAQGHDGKFLMVITMHDELVFEIDFDIISEALEMIDSCMARNPMIASRNWPVPILTDVEIGDSWMPKYDLKDLKYGRVRKDGIVIDEHGDVDKKKARWPQELMDTFLEAWGEGGPKPAPAPDKEEERIEEERKQEERKISAPHPDGFGGTDEESHYMSQTSAAKLRQEAEERKPVVDLPSEDEFDEQNGTYTVTIQGPLYATTAYELAGIIHRCRGSGSERLIVESGGKVLFDDGTQVDSTKMSVLLKEAGIC